MLDTRLADDITLRCDALADRIAATPIGKNARALRVGLAEFDALERASLTPFALCKLRNARHWLRLAYGDTLHAYPPARLRRILIEALAGISEMARRA